MPARRNAGCEGYAPSLCGRNLSHGQVRWNCWENGSLWQASYHPLYAYPALRNTSIVFGFEAASAQFRE